MSTVARPLEAPHHGVHAAPTSFWRKYIFSLDHKVIGRQYLFYALFMLIIGGLLAGLVRWQLAWPGQPIGFMGKLAPEGMPGGVMLPEFYNSLFTMHATIMIFFAIMPILIGAFGNFVVPLQIGARDMAFPTLNMLSFWTAVPGARRLMTVVMKLTAVRSDEIPRTRSEINHRVCPFGMTAESGA